MFNFVRSMIVACLFIALPVTAFADPVCTLRPQRGGDGPYMCERPSGADTWERYERQRVLMLRQAKVLCTWRDMKVEGVKCLRDIEWVATEGYKQKWWQDEPVHGFWVESQNGDLWNLRYWYPTEEDRLSVHHSINLVEIEYLPEPEPPPVTVVSEELPEVEAYVQEELPDVP